ncbi:MAG: hypothetical protein L3J09_01585 [Flavobacteriaceae bacterium]|nr:hypothetical protein [Flavobacteriaceae bacterium]
MKQFKGFTLVLFTILFSSCGGSKSNNKNLNISENPPFTISKTYCQKWVAGVKGGGSGINLIITFSSVSEGIDFNEIYFRGKIIEATSKKQNQIVGYFKNETNQNVIMDSDISKEAANTPPQKFPFQLEDNEAVISYSNSDSNREEKTYYYKISNIEEKEMLAYPQSNPKIEN